MDIGRSAAYGLLLGVRGLSLPGGVAGSAISPVSRTGVPTDTAPPRVVAVGQSGSFAEVAPCSCSQPTTFARRVSRELAASNGVPSAYWGTQLRSAP